MTGINSNIYIRSTEAVQIKYLRKYIIPITIFSVCVWRLFQIPIAIKDIPLIHEARCAKREPRIIEIFFINLFTPSKVVMLIVPKVFRGMKVKKKKKKLRVGSFEERTKEEQC